MKRGYVALLATLLVAGAVGCGGDDEGEARTVPRPKLTVPTDTSTNEKPDTQTQTVPTQEATQPPADPPAAEPESGGGPPPAPPRSPSKAKPDDGPGQDAPPPKGSPAERFEKFCEDNPGACG